MRGLETLDGIMPWGDFLNHFIFVDGISCKLAQNLKSEAERN